MSCWKLFWGRCAGSFMDRLGVVAASEGPCCGVGITSRSGDVFAGVLLIMEMVSARWLFCCPRSLRSVCVVGCVDAFPQTRSVANQRYPPSSQTYASLSRRSRPPQRSRYRIFRLSASSKIGSRYESPLPLRFDVLVHLGPLLGSSEHTPSQLRIA